jgi:homoserine kinase
MKRITVTTPATTANLGPGFDCLGLALGLYNQVTFIPRRAGLKITVQGENAEAIPRDETNLVARAAARLFSYVNVRQPGLEIQLVNRIPVGSGQGSSAAAVIGGLVAASALLPAPPTQQELLRLANELEGHPDNVTPAMLGGLALVVQDGQQLVVERIDIPTFPVLIVLPDFQLPTVQARAALPDRVGRADVVFNASRLALLIRALQVGDMVALRLAMQDRIHQPFRLPLIPGMLDAFARVQAAGAAVALSGAGPAMVILAHGDHQALAALAIEAFEGAGLRARSWVLPIDGRGAVLQS